MAHLERSGAAGASSISTMTGAATLRSSQVLQPRGGRESQTFPVAPSSATSGRSAQEEAQHFIRCPACGGWIDCRDLVQVFEHEGPLPHPTQDQPQ